MSISVDIPDAVLFDTHMTPDFAEAYVKKAVALSYYTKNGVSLGYCAEIAGMTKTEFMRFLGENNVCVFHYDDENEFAEELKNA